MVRVLSGTIVICFALSATAWAQNRPVVFAGVGATGIGPRPIVANPIPGWNVPRLFPSIGGAPIGCGPITPVNFNVFVAPAPLYVPPYLMGPVVTPVVEPIDLSPPAGPQLGQAAGRFRPVAPQDRELARRPVAPAPPPEPPPVEHDRLIRTGRTAFAAGEYGRAAELFRRAANVLPERADGHLLSAQAAIALGKYPEAAAAMHRGARLQPAWPSTGPKFDELYGPRRADFDEHLRRLEAAARDRPDDAAVQFVYAVARWFTDRRPEARQALTALQPVVADPAVIDLFLAVP